MRRATFITPKIKKLVLTMGPEEENRLQGLEMKGAPAELGRLISLVTVHIENNAVAGTMPMELSQWGNVREFLFHGNNFTGSVNDVLCSGAKQWYALQSDCLATNNDEVEIECQCCTICCNSAGVDCQVSV